MAHIRPNLRKNSLHPELFFSHSFSLCKLIIFQGTAEYSLDIHTMIEVNKRTCSLRNGWNVGLRNPSAVRQMTCPITAETTRTINSYYIPLHTSMCSPEPRVLYFLHIPFLWDIQLHWQNSDANHHRWKVANIPNSVSIFAMEFKE